MRLPLTPRMMVPPPVDRPGAQQNDLPLFGVVPQGGVAAAIAGIVALLIPDEPAAPMAGKAPAGHQLHHILVTLHPLDAADGDGAVFLFCFHGARPLFSI